MKESQLEKLEYLKMVVKEVLRLHPPIPLLPRETMSHFKLNDYDIDPKCHLYVNVWAIGRDVNYWSNPEEFLPERFIGSDINYMGQHFGLLPTIWSWSERMSRDEYGDPCNGAHAS